MPKSFPFYKQFELADCGAACLRMVADFYGQKYSLKYLKTLTGASSEGVSLQDINDAAEFLGLKTYGAELDFETLRDDAPLPAIIFWQGYHFVVVFDIKENSVVIGNPAADSILEISKEEFVFNWVPDDENPTGIALLLESTPEFNIRKEDILTDKSIASFIWKNLFAQKGLFWQLVFGVILVGILQFSMPFLIMSLVDIGIVSENIDFLWIVLGGMVVFLGSQVLVEFIRGALLNFIGIKFHVNLLTNFVAKLVKMPMQFFNSRSLGDIMQRISDSDRLERFFHSSAMFSLFSVVNLVVFGVVLFLFNWQIAGVFVVGTIVYLMYINSFLKRRRILNFQRFDQSAIAHNYLLDIFAGIQDIKLFGAERQRLWTWEDRQAKLFKLNDKALRLEQWQTRGAYFINELKNIIILVIASQAVIEGQMSLGMMLATMYIIGQMSAPVNYLVEFFQNYQEASISFERMTEIEEEFSKQPENELAYTPKSGNIKVENLAYQYGGPGSKVVLKNINLTIPHGKTIAIVGSNGSGKSTLMKLLLGILQPSVGSVKIGGVALNSIDSNYWLSKVSAVLHEGYIFNDTIARNIALGQDNKDNEKLRSICKLVNLQNYIDELPQHYNTIVGEGGSGLSQGLRQRLLLARALYKDPEFLFLDEATNALDSYNETVIMENVKDQFHDKTLVYIAHRLGTISSADLIVVIEEGEVVEVGGHGELYDKGGVYHNFVRRQLSLG